jgi:hypothetical protein
VLGLWLERDKLEAAFFVDGDRAGELADGVEAALPGWAKKGWGGVRLALPPGAVLKVDGSVSARAGEVVPLTAGPHQLDVVFSDGSALLQRVDVAEGSRTRVDTMPPAPPAPVRTTSVLRVSGTAAWMVGAATLLSAFIVGYVGRQTASGQNPCTVSSRECVTYAMAQDQSRASSQYALTANVLLGVGLVLALAGAGLFTFDVLR